MGMGLKKEEFFSYLERVISFRLWLKFNDVGNDEGFVALEGVRMIAHCDNRIGGYVRFCIATN